MYYADSDFFIALLKKADWLKPSASEILDSHKGKIRTSGYAIAEILLISEEFDLDPEAVVLSIFQIAEVGELEENRAKKAAHYMKHMGLSTFDALHAAHCDRDKMISSDSVFDKLGIERIRLGNR